MRKISKWLLSAVAMSTALTSTAGSFKSERTDFRDETIYFAMTTRFYDGDPKNNVLSWDKQDVQMSKDDPDWRGDFKGLIDKLDYIKALGFTAVWITPVVQNASGEDYHGYHAMDFSNVDLRYESRKEWGAEKDVKFQDLIDAAHEKDMKIILDIVLQHTSNFGEAYLNPLFTRDPNIKNQATPAGSLKPNERLSSNYFDQDGKKQYEERWKYFKNPQYEPNNYYHHYGTGWNWDLPNRWWGQIAGDCVDLNTENNYVAEYLVKCYGKFIEMGVDGFRIDTTGHIAPLTFNKQFIPQFHEIANRPDVKKKRLNGCDFFMFGECCQRFQGSVVYRDQPNLSSYFYTWKSDQSLLDEYNGDPEWWKAQVLPEGHDTPVGAMAVCEKDTKDKPTSNNVLMQNGAWHEPDYSQYSGFSVIDFPMHYSFGNAGSAVSIARSGDNKYNDASFNVVYVDSHDYCPGPNDGTRFNGGTAQWAENLSLMFTFRGIPCIYYGSEVEFKKGLPIDVGGENNKTARSLSGRAYFGNYLEGTVTAEDFGKYTASGNVETTLNGDLSQHIRRLNLIRAAVPALRKGQYTFDGCSANGGWAFKRAYKDSYALVAINGGATFSDVPAGTYTDLVTGKTYQGGGTITVDAPHTQGQLRVLVKGWTGSKVGEDGKFIYTTEPVPHGGNPEFADVGTPYYYGAEDVIKRPTVTFSPAGGSFKTETVTVTAALNESGVSGWFKVGNGAQQTLTAGTAKTFTIGEGMSYGESVTVTWSATSEFNDTNTGSVTYKKVDPNASITIYVTGKDGANISGTKLHAWTDKGDLFGGWPGIELTETVDIDGRTFYYKTIDDAESVNIILNRNGAQTGDIKGITEDTYFEYDGGTNANKINVSVTPVPSVKFSPNGGNFVDNVTVNVTVANATSAWYKIGNNARTDISGNSASFTLGNNMAVGESVTVSWSASNSTETKTGSVNFTKIEKPVEPEGITVYYDNSLSNWDIVKVHYWGKSESKWPGDEMKSLGNNLYVCTLPEGTTGAVFNNNDHGDQTVDVSNPQHNHIYKGLNDRNHENKRQVEDKGMYSGVDGIEINDEEAPVEYYNLQGVRVINPTPGIYIQRQGNKVRKIRVM